MTRVWFREALACRPGGKDDWHSRLLFPQLPRDGLRTLASLLLLLSVILCGPHAHAAPGVLTSARAIHDLPAAEAAKAISVHLVATVTYYQPQENALFVADASGAVYVRTRHPYPVHRGDLIEINGVTAPSFRSMVATNPQIRVLRSGGSFPVKPSSYRQLLSAELDCQYVSIRGVVRSANLEVHDTRTVAQLEILVPGGIVQGYIKTYHDVNLSQLIDAEVQLNGVAGAVFNARWQLMQTLLYVSDPNDLTILREPKVKPVDLPLTHIDDVVQTRFVVDKSKRVRVEGTVTYYEPGHSLVIQHSDRSLLVLTRRMDPVKLGSVVDVTGFADNREYSPTLEEADIAPTGRFESLAPQPLSYPEAISGVYSNSLISLRGRVLSELQSETSNSMVVLVDDHPVNVVIQGGGQAPLPDLPPGTLVKITGICRITLSGTWGKPLLFRLDMRQSKDLEIVARPSWWTVTHLLMVMGALLVLFLIIMTWAVLLRRRVASQTEQIDRSMRVERQRSRLLEEINSEMPLKHLLDDISSSITALVPDVRCSCVLVEDEGRAYEANGIESDERLEPSYVTPLTDSTGAQIGVFRVNHTVSQKFSDEERETLTIGAGLANLAVNQRRMYRELTYQSMHDQLTGLPNRRFADAQLEATVREAALPGMRFGVAYIDIDRFKEVNDQYGHKIGDLYLQQIGARLAAKVRTTDTLARIGGDEFLLLATALQSREEIEAYKLRLERCFDTAFVVDGIRIRGSLSIGLAVFPDNGTTAEELKRHADIEMYFAKHCDRVGEEQLVKKSQITEIFSTADLKAALAEDQFKLFYQPQFSSHGQLRGLEALIRLDDPILGLVNPDSFIAVAERTDFILPLGAWVLRKALSDAARWQVDLMEDVRIVVNISARQLEQLDFADQVVLVLAESGVPAHSLELEITERTVVSDISNAVRQLTTLRAHGVRISLDDFGIDHSCLSVLHKLPFDTVKIDRSFIRAISTEPGVLLIIEAIVNLGRSMKKRVVAEGVENEQEIAILLQLGDMDFQGFAFSPPLPPQDIAPSLEGWLRGLGSNGTVNRLKD